jgi:hypothetical protein
MPVTLKTTNHRFVRRLVLAVGLTAVLGSSAFADPSAPAGPAASANMQGDQSAWINDPHTRAFYDLTVAAFANGPAALDKAKYEQDSRRLFRDFGKSMGMSPDAMEDHLKLIPDQVIQIATDDPKVLTNFDRFIAAIFGPQ